MGKFDPTFSNAIGISQALDKGDTTSVQILEATLSRIKRLDPHLNAFVCLTEERAFEEASKADERRSNGIALGPLDGVPYAVKDIFDVAGIATMAGVRLLEDNIADEDCFAVKQLTEAGMVLIGKTHTVELAASINGTNSDFGTPHNPWLESHHLPGGSSSGSAVAVASGMVPVALGSDTAGSIRVPAGLTGITGFMPSGGQLGRGGVRPLSWSLDRIGPLTRTVRDAALIFETMQGGNDPRDETTWIASPAFISEKMQKGVSGLNIILCDTVFFDDCDPGQLQAIDKVAETLSTLGAKVFHAQVPEINDVVSQRAKGIIFDTEGYAVNRAFFDTYKDDLGPEFSWIEEGKNISGYEYYDAVRTRFELQRRFNDRLGDNHAILMPATTHPAWPVDKINNGENPPISYTRNAAIGNYLNLSSITFPCGFNSAGLPLAAMICSRSNQDEMALRIAGAYQASTQWHEKIPELNWISE